MAGIGLWTLDAWVHTEDARQRMETAASNALKTPVTITEIRYGLLKGLSLHDVQLQVGDSRVTVPRLTARIAWRALLKSELALEALIIHQPMVVLIKRDMDAIAALGKSPKKPATEEVAPVDKDKKKRKMRIQFHIYKATLENGTIYYLEKPGKEEAVLENVNIRCRIDSDERVQGKLSVKKVRLQGQNVDAISTNFLWEKVRLEISQLRAQLFGGTLAGHLDLSGFDGKPEQWKGPVRLQMQGGRMGAFPILAMLGKVLAIEDLQTMEMKQGLLELELANGKIAVQTLHVESANLQVLAQGTCLWDGALKLDAKLVLGPQLSRLLPRQNERQLPFTVTGTVQKPQVNLLQELIGKQYAEPLQNLWQSVQGKTKLPVKKPTPKKK